MIAVILSDGERTDLVEQLGRTVAAVNNLIAKIRPEQWSDPTAIEQPAALPEDVSEQSLAFVRTQLTEQDRPGRFGPVRPVDDQAPALERLVAYLGREVNWTASG